MSRIAILTERSRRDDRSSRRLRSAVILTERSRRDDRSSRRLRSAVLLSVILICTGFASPAPGSGDVTSVEDHYRQWIFGGTTLDPRNPWILARHRAVVDRARTAMESLDKLNVADTSPLSLAGRFNPGLEEFKKITAHLYMAAMALHLKPLADSPNPFYGDARSKVRVMDTFSYLQHRGIRKGMECGYEQAMKKYPETFHPEIGNTPGNNFTAYALSVFVMKGELKEAGVLGGHVDALAWGTSVIGPEWASPAFWRLGGLNADCIRAQMNARLLMTLSMDAGDPRRIEEMAHLSKLLSKALRVAPGFADCLKPDGMGYHHENAYLNSYAVYAFHKLAFYARLFAGTAFAVEARELDTLVNAVLANRIYCQTFDVARGPTGRFPYKLDTLRENLPEFAYLAGLSDDRRPELTAAFLRLWRPGDEAFREFVESVTPSIQYFGGFGALEACLALADSGGVAEQDPLGTWFFPYGGLGVHRAPGWMVSFKGFSKYIWDYEASPVENLMGRYTSFATVQVFATGDPVTARESGYGNAGWNWCRLPGATTCDLPRERVPTVERRQFSPSSFLGGVDGGDGHGVFSMTLVDPNTPLTAHASVFLFDDLVFFLGSDIGMKGGEDPVQTTLTQLELVPAHTRSVFQGKAMQSMVAEGIHTTDAVTCVDSRNHGWFVPRGQHVVYTRARQNEPPASGDTKGKSGKKAVLETAGDYECLRILHGAHPDAASYRFALKVLGGETGAEALRDHFESWFIVSRCDAVAHIVTYPPKKVTGFAIRRGNVELGHGWVRRADQPCLLMVREGQGGFVHLSLQNPEFGRFAEAVSFRESEERAAIRNAPSTVQPVQLTLRGNWSVASPDEGVKRLRSGSAETTLCFPCMDGKQISVAIHPVP